MRPTIDRVIQSLLIVFIVLLLATLNCSKDDPAAPAPKSNRSTLFACSSTVNITVGSGITPTFSWTPACSLFFLLVEGNTGGDQWSVISDSTNAIAPPVTYGIVPPGATADFPPTTLVSGMSYDVLVARWTGPGAQDGVIIGSKTFTP